MIRLDFIECVSDEQLTELSAMAYDIWREFFPAVISTEQIEYMLEKFQSPQAMIKQTAEEGYHYYMVKVGSEQAGYFAVCKKDTGMKLMPENALFLSKFYLKKEMRGKGIASLMFKEIRRIARKEGCELIWLTVNKGNEHAISVYKKFGMRIIRDQTADIGSGFVMDDHVFGIMI